MLAAVVLRVDGGAPGPEEGHEQPQGVEVVEHRGREVNASRPGIPLEVLHWLWPSLRERELEIE